jgi:hypothetical protein
MRALLAALGLLVVLTGCSTYDQPTQDCIDNVPTNQSQGDINAAVADCINTHGGTQ